MTEVVIFEENYQKLLPITYTKTIPEILCGGRRQIDRITSVFGLEKTTFLVRKELEEYFKHKWKTGVNEIPDSRILLVINGNFLFLDNELKALDAKLDQGQVLVGKRGIIALKVKKDEIEKLIDQTGVNRRCVKKLYKKTYRGRERKIEYPWDLIEHLKELIIEDSKFLRGKFRRLKGDRGGYPILMSDDVSVEKHVYIDCTDGPVILEDQVEIQSFSRISGPVWVKRGSIILSGLIREGSIIGEVCKVGGEMEMSIMDGYSNKAHGSYLGHSYVGEWVNIGAFTVTSDLKNTYGTVRMNINGRKIDSKKIKLGSFIADFAKTSISTSIYAGKKIGVSSHVHGVVYDDVPSFTFWANRWVMNQPRYS